MGGKTEIDGVNSNKETGGERGSKSEEEEEEGDGEGRRGGNRQKE